MGKMGRQPACTRQRSFEQGIASGEITHQNGREISKELRNSYVEKFAKEKDNKNDNGKK